MTQALMPGDEPIETTFKPAPEYSAPPVQSRGELAGIGGALEGCSCEACNQMRGRVSRQPQVQNYPRNLPPGLISGRYDFRLSNTPNSSMHGVARWLDPQTGECFDEHGQRQWAFDRTPAGWASRDGVRFEPNPSRADYYAEMAAMLADTRPPPPALQVFNWDISPAFGDIPGISRGGS